MQMAALFGEYQRAFETKYAGRILPSYRKAIAAIIRCRTPEAGTIASSFRLLWREWQERFIFFKYRLAFGILTFRKTKLKYVLRFIEKENDMDRVKVSSKFQIVIPKAVRERMHLTPGQEMGVIEKGGIAHLVPLKTLEELQGIAKGANIEGFREKQDRF